MSFEDLSDQELLKRYLKAIVGSWGNPFAGCDRLSEELGDELLRRGITEYQNPALKEPSKIYGSDPKFKEQQRAYREKKMHAAWREDDVR